MVSPNFPSGTEEIQVNLSMWNSNKVHLNLSLLLYRSTDIVSQQEAADRHICRDNSFVHRQHSACETELPHKTPISMLKSATRFNVNRNFAVYMYITKTERQCRFLVYAFQYTLLLPSFFLIRNSQKPSCSSTSSSCVRDIQSATIFLKFMYNVTQLHNHLGGQGYTT